ncbi:MAG: universal stress protein [Deltaproteobacteria bacterium]|jgi:nucleotide-binding universal stress UspA family protein|nr:universal stress protein [Deltaproteobacteria bacterium]MBW2500400.1 universal stress protein [Deltaproteobacteria bacterium]
MKIETILVPTDFSEDAQHALGTAKELARQFGSKLVLLHAYRVDLPMSTPALGGGFILPDGFYEDLRAHATKQVEELAAETSKEGFEVSGIAMEDRASVAIVEEAKRLPADLIVMGTRGLTGLKHVALGSVAERVVRDAPCPVLTVKAPS